MLLTSTGCFLLYFAAICEASWRLIWSDEFDGQSIDLTKWTFDLGKGCLLDTRNCGWGNWELQSYTNDIKNVFLKGGYLVIQAAQNGQEYTSARIKTKDFGDWSIAKIEIRAKFPRDDAINPSIWMFPTDMVYGVWPTSGAIDIAVMRTIESPFTLKCGVTYGYNVSDFDETFKIRLPMSNSESFFDDFHIFTLEKLKDELRWFVDGQKIYQVARSDLVFYYLYPFNERFHLILSMAVGGKFSVSPSGFTEFPQLFLFDYVRIYSWNEEFIEEMT